MKKLHSLMAIALLLTACATTEDPHPNILIVSQNIVMGCKHVGHISTSSKNYGLFTETASEARVKNAKIEAAKLGATHIVMTAPVKQDGTTTNEGEAYICGR